TIDKQNLAAYNERHWMGFSTRGKRRGGNDMKRYLSVFLAVLLTAAFSCGALADYDPATAAFTAYDTGSSDVEFNPAAGTYADYVQLNGQQGFAIFGSDGTLLSDACYPTMQYCGSDEPYYVVASEGDDVANRWGLVDGYTGQLS